MGQPIKIIKGSKTLTVYGLAQLAVMEADGWKTLPAAGPPPAKVEHPPAASPPAVKATKGAAALAKKNNIDLTAVSGTGAGGAVTMTDVRKVINGN